jgi:hypothetical protein
VCGDRGGGFEGGEGGAPFFTPRTSMSPVASDGAFDLLGSAWVTVTGVQLMANNGNKPANKQAPHFDAFSLTTIA